MPVLDGEPLEDEPVDEASLDPTAPSPVEVAAEEPAPPPEPSASPPLLGEAVTSPPADVEDSPVVVLPAGEVLTEALADV
jgi:hypothetical protein